MAILASLAAVAGCGGTGSSDDEDAAGPSSGGAETCAGRVLGLCTATARYCCK